MARKKGRGRTSPNLKRTGSGQLVNQYGVKFTEQEKKALENAVNKVHYKRKKMLKEAATLPRTVMGKPTGDTVGSLQLMGKESDFILTKKTKSLQRFHSKEQYNQYMKYLDRANSPGYVHERVKLYKRNYMKALDNAYGDDAKDIKMKIRMMKPDEFMKKVTSDELLEIQYVYTPEEQQGKLNQLRASLGMKLKEEPIEDEG